MAADPAIINGSHTMLQKRAKKKAGLNPTFLIYA